MPNPNRRRKPQKNKGSMSTLDSMRSRAGGKTFRERTAQVDDYDFSRDLPLEGGGSTPFASGSVSPRELTAATRDYDFGARPLPTQRFQDGGIVQRFQNGGPVEREDRRLPEQSAIDVPSAQNLPSASTQRPSAAPSPQQSSLGRLGGAMAEPFIDANQVMNERRAQASGPVEHVGASVRNIGTGLSAFPKGATQFIGGVATQLGRGMGFQGDQSSPGSAGGSSNQPTNGSNQPYGGNTPTSRPTMTAQVGTQRAGSTIAGLQDIQRGGLDITPEGMQGEARVFPGTGNNEAARQALFDRIDERARLGQEAARGRIARGGQGGGDQQTMFGRFEGDGMDYRTRELYDTLNDEIGGISQMLERAANTNYEPGRPGRGARRGMSARRMGVLADQLDTLVGARDQLLGNQVDMRGQDAATERVLGQTALSNQGAMARTMQQGENQLAGIEARINDPLNQIQAEASRMALEREGIELPNVARPDFESISDPSARAQAVNEYENALQGQDIGSRAIVQSGGNAMQAYEQMRAMLDAQLAELGGPEGIDEEVYANRIAPLENGIEYLEQAISTSGFIPRQGSQNVQSFADGGIVGAMGAMPGMGGGMDMPSIQNYQQYVELARQMGVDPVDLTQFSAMGASAPAGRRGPPMPEMQRGAMGSQKVLGMAEGGMVPSPDEMMAGQVDEKMIVDPDPNAPVDSIPAVIDGTQPARLDSGEFVMPADVVLHFGTEKLGKMIEQARTKRNPDGPEAQS